MNILHIIEDNKFFKIAEDTFDIPSIKNIFIRSKDFSSINLSEINVIFFHYLTNEAVEIINNNVFTNIKLVWMFWGNDGLSLPNFYLKFLENLEKEKYNKFALNKGVIYYLKYKIKKKCFNFFNYSKSIQCKLNAINKFDCIVPVVPGDYELLKEQYKIKPNFIHFNYYIEPNFIAKKTGDNILIGNSASFTNNHFSILNKIIKCKNITNKKIILPLNYGDIDYLNYLKKFIIKNCFYNIFLLEDFLPLDEYNKIISSCDIVIMNHSRQQALGNIIMALNNKCTIYMNSNSTLYNYLISEGFNILDTKNITDEINKLSDHLLDENFNLSCKIFSKKFQTEKICNLLKDLSK